MSPALRVFLDASVLYPVSLRSLLMRLILAKLFQARWSATIHEEWIRAVLRDRPDIPEARLHRLRDAMNERAGDEVLVTGYESLIEFLTLPDADDRHVLAAAIVGKASLIVTRNLRDFPDDALRPYQIRAIHPDRLIQQVLATAPAKVLEIVRDQQASLVNPPVSMSELLELYERLDLKGTVAALRLLIGQAGEQER